MNRLQDKVVIVTGASSGLGEAAAQLIAAEGGKVVVAARRRDRGEAVVAGIEAKGGQAVFIETDVTRTGDVEAMVAKAISQFGRLDGAVNNAGASGATLTAMVDLTEADWDLTLDTNLRAVWMCMKHEIPAMLTNGKGAIVNISSIYGTKPSDIGAAPYCASKFGLIGLTKCAAVDYGDKGVRTNAVCPGFTHSEMVDPYTVAAPDLVTAALARHSAMNRLGEGSEIAEAIVWLLSDAASFVNGAALTVDGGDTTRLY